MIQVMAWVLRSQRLKRLKAAASISISVDDRAEFRLVRYRCSYDSPESFAAACSEEEKRRLFSIFFWSQTDLSVSSFHKSNITFLTREVVPTNAVSCCLGRQSSATSFG